MQLPSPVRVLGIDLGLTSDHTAVVVDDTGSICARRRARSTVASLAALEAAALDGAALGTQLVVVIEPTGPAWLPVAVFFGRRGHTVLRVTSAKAADLRRFLARHAKSNSIDAETLARLPLVAPTGLMPVEFGSPARASLDRRVRAVARLTAEIGRRKTRIRALAQLASQLVSKRGNAVGVQDLIGSRSQPSGPRWSGCGPPARPDQPPRPLPAGRLLHLPGRRRGRRRPPGRRRPAGRPRPGRPWSRPPDPGPRVVHPGRPGRVLKVIREPSRCPERRAADSAGIAGTAATHTTQRTHTDGPAP